MLRFDIGLLFWTFYTRGPRTVRLAHAIQLFLNLKTSWMSFFCCGLVSSFRHRKTIFAVTNQKLFCFSNTWRRLVMPEEDLWCLTKLSTLEDIVLDAQESLLVALRTPIWLLHTRFAWQTKLWLSKDVSVRFNQNLLKQCIHKYYIRLSG